MEYKILDHHSHTALEVNVNTYLNRGWRLHGSLVVANGQFYQTIVKEK